MGFEKTFNVGDREVTVYELTVREVRDMAKAAGSNSGDLIAELLVEGLPFSVVTAMTNLTADQLEDMRPSELNEVAAKCREVNAGFFDMDSRASKLMRGASGASQTT